MASLELKRSGPAEGWRPSGAALEELRDRGSGRRLLCRACGAPLTSEGERMVVEGAHVHRRTNPAGITFEFGCFGAAPGVACVGEPTTAFTWFPGHAWVVALCRRCGAHLGWRFEGEPRFHALVLERMVPEDGGGPLPG